MGLAALEALLRARQLDHTLSSALVRPRHDELAVAATGLASLDTQLYGGFPRGQLSEVVGPRTSGRTSLLLQMLAAATDRGEPAAMVDALDTLDVESAAAARLDLDRLLWIRGHVVVNPGMCRDLNQRALEQAIRALGLVLQSGIFGVVVFDVADAPHDAICRLPFTTWLRLQRMLEGTQTACVLVGAEPMARSAAGLTLRLALGDGGETRGEEPHGGTPRERKTACAIRFRARLFEGVDVTASVVRARARDQRETVATFATAASHV